jgi:hypothetical protein
MVYPRRRAHRRACEQRIELDKIGSEVASTIETASAFPAEFLRLARGRDIARKEFRACWRADGQTEVRIGFGIAFGDLTDYPAKGRLDRGLRQIALTRGWSNPSYRVFRIAPKRH